MGLPQRRCRAGVPRGSARSWPLVAGAPRPRRAPARPRPPPRRPPRIPVTTKENIFGWKLREGRHGNTAAGFRQKPIVPAQKGAPGPCSLRRCKTGRGWGRSRAGPTSRGTQVPPCRGAPSLSLVWLGTWGAAGTPLGRWEQLGAELSVPIQAGRAVWDRAEDEDELLLQLGNPKSDPKSLSPKMMGNWGHPSVPRGAASQNPSFQAGWEEMGTKGHRSWLQPRGTPQIHLLPLGTGWREQPRAGGAAGPRCRPAVGCAPRARSSCQRGEERGGSGVY